MHCHHIFRNGTRLGAMLCLFAPILLVLPHLARCGGAHPVITSPRSTNTLTQDQQHSSTSNNNNNQMYQLGRSHQPYSEQAAAANNQNKLYQPNLPSLSNASPSLISSQYDDITSSQPHSQAISTRSASIQKLLPTQQRVMPASTLMSNQQQLNSMLTNPYTNATHMLLLDLRQQLITRAIKFDEHFRSLLTQSKLSLHNMFMDTYGMIYEHNTEIFTIMYEDLEQYYATGNIKLTKSMEDFFARLYQKIFQVYNSNRVFSKAYLECATEQLTQLKPFKDAPDKLIGDIRHAFVAARTFNQALNSGIDIIKNIISLGSPPQCVGLMSEKLLKQQDGNGAKLPCLGFCEQVISRCIGRANLDPLNNSWKAYVVALSELAKKLSVQYNIETIIGPIDVQISEAIMNFQENAQNISHQVFQACGRASPASAQLEAQLVSPSGAKPQAHVNRLGKRALPAAMTASAAATAANARRNVNQQPAYANQHHHSMGEYGGGGGGGGASPQSAPKLLFDAAADTGAAPSAAPVSIGRRSPAIIGDIRDYMLSTKSFWSNLPNAVCTSNYTLGSSAARSASNLLRKNSPGCFSEQLGLSDMNSDLRYRAEIQQQIRRLDVMYTKITDAQRGVEIDWSMGPDYHRAPSVAITGESQPANGGGVANSHSSAANRPLAGYPSTSTTMSELPEDDQEPDDTLDQNESGSGKMDETDDLDEEEFKSKPEQEDGDSDDEEPDESTGETAPVVPPIDASPPGGDNSDLEGLKPAIDLNTSNELITASDQSPQKSAGATLEVSQLLLGLFSLCAFSVVNFVRHTNNCPLARAQLVWA